VRRALLTLCLTLLLAGPAAARPDGPPAPPAREYIQNVLESEHVALRFQAAPLAEVVRTLQETVWLNVVLDPAVDRSLTITSPGTDARPLGPALDALLAPLELEATVWCDVLYVHRRGEALPAPPPAEVAGALPAYTLQHAVTPLREVLDSLRDLSHVRIELTPAATDHTRQATVSLRVRNLTLPNLLTLLAHQVGLEWAATDGVVWLHVPGEDVAAVQAYLLARQGEARVTASFDASPLEDAASVLRALSGVEVRLGEGVPRDLPVTLHVTDASVRQALDDLTRPAGLAWRREGTSVVIVKP
jgi:type II secretory pathway component HofQ